MLIPEASQIFVQSKQILTVAVQLVHLRPVVPLQLTHNGSDDAVGAAFQLSLSVSSLWSCLQLKLIKAHLVGNSWVFLKPFVITDML